MHFLNFDISFNNALWNIGANANIINVKHAKLTFNIGDGNIEFIMFNLMNSPFVYDSLCMLDIINHCVKEYSFASPPIDRLETCLIGNTIQERNNGQVDG